MRAEIGDDVTTRMGRCRILFGAVLLLTLSGLGVDVRAQTSDQPAARSIAPLITPPVQRVLPPEQPDGRPPQMVGSNTFQRSLGGVIAQFFCTVVCSLAFLQLSHSHFTGFGLRQSAVADDFA